MPTERFPVEASHIMMFARSVGDFNPIYHDEDYAAQTDVGHIIAPPTFPQAHAQFDPDYYLRPKPGKPWFGSGATPTGKPASDSGGSSKEGTAIGTGSGGLHAEQHFEYHRQLRPGDVLTVTSFPGKKWEKQSKRAGTLEFAETIQEYRDQNGELVITARGVGVRTEKPVEN